MPQTPVLDLPIRRMISVVPHPLSRKQHDPGSPRMLLRHIAVRNEGLKAPALSRRDGEFNRQILTM
jgi:hypothetical protein